MKNNVTVELLLESKKAEELIKDLSFEDGMKLLEALVAQVEGGALSLEKGILAYERGVQLTNQLRDLLGGAEAKLKTLQVKN